MGKKKDTYSEYIEPLEGQLSVWDVLEMGVSKTNIKRIEHKAQERRYDLTGNYYNLSQEKCIRKYENLPELNRIIKYSFGAIGVELKEGNEYKTIYINNKGVEEFIIKDKSSVLPNDKILFYNKSSEFNTTSIQEQRLKEFQSGAQRVIRRNGDENIILEFKNKTLSVNKKGWILEFFETKVDKDNDTDIKELCKEESKDEISIGDIVRFQYGKEELIDGKVTHIYGENQESLCVNFNKCNTAIWRGLVKEIISKV